MSYLEYGILDVKCQNFVFLDPCFCHSSTQTYIFLNIIKNFRNKNTTCTKPDFTNKIQLEYDHEDTLAC